MSMYIVTEATYYKNGRVITKNQKGMKFWVTPPTLFRSKENAEAFFQSRARENRDIMLRNAEDPQVVTDYSPNVIIIKGRRSSILMRLTEDDAED